jgi:arylsulfatase A-like enzyme
MVHVPLIIWGHGIMPRELADRVSLLDVGPTVLHLFRMPPPVGSSGLSLLPLIALSDGRVERPVFSEGRLRRAMYTRDNLKVIEDGVRRVVEAYDLSADPDELLNLFDSGDERVHRAVAELRAWYAVHTLRYEGYEPPYKP